MVDTPILQPEDLEVERTDSTWSKHLIGLYCTDEEMNPDRMKRAVMKAWNILHRLEVQSVGENLFVFLFFNLAEYRRVRNGGPWTFSDNLIALNEWNPSMDAKPELVTYAAFWMKLENMQPEHLNFKAPIMFAQKAGEVLNLFPSSGIPSQGKMARARVKLDIRVPLKEITPVKLKSGIITKINFLHERLPTNFCYSCRILAHSDVRWI